VVVTADGSENDCLILNFHSSYDICYWW